MERLNLKIKNSLSTTVFLNNTPETKEDQVSITYYTDPLCCWSWAFEPQWRRLRYEYDGHINWKYRMGGLLASWETYEDPLNAVSKPVQMGPVWMEASVVSGMPINHQIWVNDPPATSYLACIAVKCAGLQSAQVEEQFLRSLREAVMLKEQNISRKEVLLDIAKELDSMDFQKFESDFKGNAGADAFRADLLETKYMSIGRYPTLVIGRPGKRSIMVTGYRPYHILLEAIRFIASDIEARQVDQDNYKLYWTDLTDRELSEIDQADADTSIHQQDFTL